jgi:hypothetical protein
MRIDRYLYHKRVLAGCDTTEIPSGTPIQASATGNRDEPYKSGLAQSTI